ncbi:permease prefix domain 1-containing protein [Alicyclobacillus herbarius]|uniref:permease prefix domain 1-containing protein n=1 Tax=Alicyclobacillus herbarius TaxID=122960 RepID=UPI00042565F4|nr:permease prefix domain 1-containing protein [Alicyclobacillus herbarius]
MLASHDQRWLEEQIEAWRGYLRRRQAIRTADVAELEDHLRGVLEDLMASGLAADEAFLVAIRRMGDLDALSREFAREHSERIWKQLVIGSVEQKEGAQRWTDAAAAFGFAILAAALIKAPALFESLWDVRAGFYIRNASLLVFPALIGYFVWKRKLPQSVILGLAAVFVAAVLFANVYPFHPAGNTEALTAMHLPIALWLVVGVAYTGGRWQDWARRMDFVRWSGELFIYYVLIALGGGVLTAVMTLIFTTIGIDAEPFFASWLLPCGAAGAVVVSSWLVEAKQSVIENMAPVLSRLFTPLFAAVLLAFLVAFLARGGGIDIGRNALIAFDLLLAVVLGLVLYSVSARDPDAPPGMLDILQVVLLISAILADAVALWAIVARISEFGWSPNRVAALGENVILLANLAWSAVLYVRFLRGRAPFSALERWQTVYLPIYALWAAAVVLLFPPVFGYI